MRSAAGPSFRVICEMRPPTQPTFAGLRQQIAILHRMAEAILVPENFIGIPTASSLTVACEVAAMGATPIACLNARDRNMLGFRRDLLTAGACGISEFLFVEGDRAPDCPPTGLSVHAMVEELRRSTADVDGRPTAVGVTSRLGPLAGWKREADRLFVQASFSLDALLSWRETTRFDGSVFAGVLVPPSASRARRWTEELPGISVPSEWITALEQDPLAGVALACALVEEIEMSGAFDGVHLIPGVRYREVADYFDRRRRLVAVSPIPFSWET